MIKSRHLTCRRRASSGSVDSVDCCTLRLKLLMLVMMTSVLNRWRRNSLLPADTTLTSDRQPDLEVTLAFSAQLQGRLEVEDDVKQLVTFVNKRLHTPPTWRCRQFTLSVSFAIHFLPQINSLNTINVSENETSSRNTLLACGEQEWVGWQESCQ